MGVDAKLFVTERMVKKALQYSRFCFVLARPVYEWCLSQYAPSFRVVFYLWASKACFRVNSS